MLFKIFGALIVILGCGGFGLKIAAAQRAEERTLRNLISVLDYMECELQYRLTPLPDLCRQSAAESSGCIRLIFSNLANELEDQISPDVERCMNAALCNVKGVPKRVMDNFVLLGSSLGRFDMNGQLKGLEAVRKECRRTLEAVTRNQDVRLRSYQTLGLCAGAAIAILFI